MFAGAACASAQPGAAAPPFRVLTCPHPVKRHKVLKQRSDFPKMLRVFSSVMEAMMRNSLKATPALKAILAGAAVTIGIGAAAGPALARDGQAHVLTVRLPDGGIEQIQYTGDVPPQVILAPAPAALAAPVFAPQFSLGPSFAAMERIAAVMDQQAAAMMRQVSELPMMTGGLVGGLPPGVSGYSMISTMAGNNVCTRSVQITFSGGNAQPRMVSHTSGNCGPDQGAGVPAEVNAPVPVPAEPTGSTPRTIEVKADGQAPYRALAHPAVWQH